MGTIQELVFSKLPVRVKPVSFGTKHHLAERKNTDVFPGCSDLSELESSGMCYQTNLPTHLSKLPAWQ